MKLFPFKAHADKLMWKVRPRATARTQPLYFSARDLFCDNQFLQGVCGCLHMRCFCPFCIFTALARLSAPRQLHLHFTLSGLELWRDRRKGHANTYLFRVCLLRNGAINFNEMSVYKSQVPELKSLVFVHMHKFSSNERVALGLYVG